MFWRAAQNSAKMRAGVDFGRLLSSPAQLCVLVPFTFEVVLDALELSSWLI
jgi:hypothetical protein